MESENTKTAEFCCPHCYETLRSDGNHEICSGCASQFERIDDIPVFVSKDSFYEGKFPHTIPFIPVGRLPHPKNIAEILHNIKIKVKMHFTMEYKNSLFLQRACSRLGPESVILDLACGGGNELYSLNGTVYGIDLSLRSLKNAKQIYFRVACADAAKLPFPKDFFDLVVSSDFFGHVPAENKDAVLEEINRVLKPGGKTVHCIETDNNNQRYLKKKFPELYEKHFLEKDGHYGLEFPRQCIERFQKIGFRPLYRKPAFTFITTIDEYLKRFDNEIAEELFLYRVLVKIMRKLNSRGKVRWATSVIFRLFDYLLNAVLPIDNTVTGMIHVIYQKQLGGGEVTRS